MFSRSEKTEEVTEAMAEPSGERSPMVLAALAGLLAIAGAFLLVWYLNSGSDDTATDGGGSTSSGVVGDNGEQGATKQVLFATREIPRGTSIQELRDAPTVYLTAEVVPEGVVNPSAIESINDLRDEDLNDQILSAAVLPGEQLLRDRFRNPSDFDSGETFLEASTGIEAPENHHSVVLELPAFRAMGGNIRPGDNVTVVGNFKVDAADGERYDISMTIFNSVEVLDIAGTLEVRGTLDNDIDNINQANRGSVTITLAVEPDELTDLTYAMEWGELFLATAVEGFDNDNDPRAVTIINGLVGDDSVWLEELEDGNSLDLLGFLLDGELAEGSSIEVEIEGDNDVPDEDNQSGDDDRPAEQDEPGDS